MKRLVVLLLALGLFVGTVTARDDEKKDGDKDKVEKKKDEKDKKDDKDKKDKDKDKDKKDKDKDKDKDKKDAVKDKKEEKEKPLTEEQKAELKKMSGTFAVIVFERDGRKSPEEELKKMKVKQEGAKWSFTDEDDVTEGIDRVFPDKKPKEIESTYTTGSNKGKKVLGIYEIEGDTIKYCWAEPDKPRPKEFASKAGSEITLMVLKRVKEGTKPKPEKDKDKDKKDEKDKKDKDKEKKDKDKDKKDEKDKKKDEEKKKDEK
jgi:uncharacterized protein (TIGR03067 family)